MIKKTALLFVAMLGTVVLLAQNPPPGAISHPPSPTGMTNQATPVPLPGAASMPTNTMTTNAMGQSNLTFTNRTGGVYSVDQLASQLQSLRQSVDQTLPLLMAFTETYSNSVGKPSVRGEISGILSRVLNGTNAPGTTAPGATQATNLLSALQQTIASKNPSATPTNATRAEDLAALQTQLQPVPSLLQKLNIAGVTNQFAAPTTPTTTTPGGVAPTGR